MMRTIGLLGEEEKLRYEKGLAALWKLHDGSAPGSPEQNDAKKKIGEFGKVLLNKVQGRRLQMQQQQQQQQQPQQNLQQPQLQQLPQQARTVGQPGQPAPQSQTPLAQGAVGPSANMGTGPSPAPASVAQPSPNPMGANAASQSARPMPPHIISHIHDVPFQAPPNIADKTKWLEDIKQRYAKALFTMENARNATKSIEQTLSDNQLLSPDDRKKLEERKVQLQKQYTDAITFANAVRKQYASGGNPKPAQNGAAAPNTTNQARPQTAGAQTMGQPGQGAGNGPATLTPTNPMQSSTAAVNAAIEAAKNQQMAAGRLAGAGNALPAQQGPLGRPHPQQIHAPGTPAHAQVSGPGIQTQPTTQIQQAQPSQQPQHPQPPIKIEPGTRPLPTPVNTALTSTVGGMQSVGTPTQNSARLHTPQSATPTTANANIRPLTHAAAINLASQQRPGGPSAPLVGGSGNVPAPALGVIGPGQQQGHSHAHPPQPTVPAPPPQSKLPIPKVLHEKATQMPTPVPNIGGIGSGRPTYSAGGGMGGGVMNQPALPKTPAYQLEGEGERILNKKKLDELVRQVCGGTAEGQEGNMLTPEVEENVLNMADSFVDNVLHQACRNAKERGSKVLEIRDIQLVLERTYNIRIPGYSSEELRTVRKVQPNSSWIKKMSAVQAAKVVPGKGDL
ncbi:hypothetical protein BT67DRAFT_389209 [Trichocladium antarcticum]|uniref:Transcription initiation factor TFIID subunit 12 domain-containing protein n=1 Tax=Trichocladium antarcticum TaxID=1450529 RepID=A0AAN6UED4_9PEZI|nr:hypothetical protein BT67DRAFT_389209 [Trichocladium antarcticum]